MKKSLPRDHLFFLAEIASVNFAQHDDISQKHPCFHGPGLSLYDNFIGIRVLRCAEAVRPCHIAHYLVSFGCYQGRAWESKRRINVSSEDTITKILPYAETVT